MNRPIFSFALILMASLLLSNCASPPLPHVHADSHVVYVPEGPPPPKAIVVPRRPSLRHVWITGHWKWHSGQWLWVTGKYVIPPRKGVRWVPGHWKHRPRGWVWIPGHWKRH